jgi:hypothetical protein
MELAKESTGATAAGPLIEGLAPRQQVVAVVLAIAILVVVVELVRKRKLREEYSVLWIATSVILLALALDYDVLTWFQRAVGAEAATSALFFGALLFLVLVSLQYSVRLSKLTARNKILCQKIALLERDVVELRQLADAEAGRTAAREALAAAPELLHEDGKPAARA